VSILSAQIYESSESKFSLSLALYMHVGLDTNKTQNIMFNRI